MHLYEVIKRPLVTEKSTTLQTIGKYAFEVNTEANKKQIKDAVEKAFKVSVNTVNVINLPASTKRVGRRRVILPAMKKAIVTLKAGDKIQLFEGV
ncbi:MAG: 50S ribosomal protein L23 [Dehalococcoidales bacterium]|nr:50S ribosomal protein L23 [Dehalococcoidales bacterium]